MSFCPKCGAQLPHGAPACQACGTRVVFHHVPHPRIAARKQHAPVRRRDLLPHESAIERFNSGLAVRITGAVGTMWCAYAFAGLALVSLPEALRGGTGALISWIAQTFLQLVLLSIIIVGQKVDGAVADKRATDTYNDAEAVLHEALQIQDHLAAQDRVLTDLVDRIERVRPA
jgi:zinc-ribbon domain